MTNTILLTSLKSQLAVTFQIAKCEVCLLFFPTGDIYFIRLTGFPTFGKARMRELRKRKSEERRFIVHDRDRVGTIILEEILGLQY